MKWVTGATVIVSLYLCVLGCSKGKEENPPERPSYEVWIGTGVQRGILGPHRYYITQYTPSGSVIGSFEIRRDVGDITSFNNRLYGVENKYIFEGSYFINVVYEMDAETGSIMSSFDLPWEAWTRGLSNDGQNLWALQGQGLLAGQGDEGETIYKLSTTGSLISSIPALNTHTRGLSYYDSYLWYFDEKNKNIIRAKEASGEKVDEFRYTPGAYCLGYDGQYIWCIVDDKVRRINHRTGDMLVEWDIPKGHSAFDLTIVFR